MSNEVSIKVRRAVFALSEEEQKTKLLLVAKCYRMNSNTVDSDEFGNECIKRCMQM